MPGTDLLKEWHCFEIPFETVKYFYFNDFTGDEIISFEAPIYSQENLFNLNPKALCR